MVLTYYYGGPGGGSTNANDPTQLTQQYAGTMAGYQAAAANAQSFEQQQQSQYQDFLSQQQAGYDQSTQQINQAAQAQTFALQQQYQQQAAAQQQGNINSGLGNTTIQDSMANQIQYNYLNSQTQLADTLNQRLVGQENTALQGEAQNQQAYQQSLGVNQGQYQAALAGQNQFQSGVYGAGLSAYNTGQQQRQAQASAQALAASQEQSAQTIAAGNQAAQRYSAQLGLQGTMMQAAAAQAAAPYRGAVYSGSPGGLVGGQMPNTFGNSGSLSQLPVSQQGGGYIGYGSTPNYGSSVPTYGYGGNDSGIGAASEDFTGY